MPSSTNSDYLFQKQLDYLLKNTAWTPPSSLYLALFTTLPAVDGTGGVEVSVTGTAYARAQILASNGWTGPYMNNGNIEYSNANDITFVTPTANWGTIVGSGLYDASTGGNLYYISSIAVPKVVNLGDGAPRVLSGLLKIARATCA